MTRSTAALKVVGKEAIPPTPPIAAIVKRMQPARSDTYNSHPAVGLTAEGLIGMYREAERGYPVRQYDCFDDMIEVDGHLRGLIGGRVDAVAGCDWVVKPGRDDAASRKAADALDDHLRHRVDMKALLEHQLMAPHYGLALTNIVWGEVDGYISPVELVHAAHRRFASPAPDRASEIWLLKGDTARDLVALDPGCWIVNRYRHRNPWAAGLMRTAAWWAMFKRWSIRDWQVFAEMFGIPLVIGFYDEGAGETSRVALEEAVRLIGKDGYAVLSDLVEIVIKESARGGDSSTVYPKIADRCDAEMSKLIAGSTTATDTGGSVGSYNLGSVHESRAYKLSLSDARGFEQSVRRDLATPFCIFNGFDRAAPPRVRVQITRDSLERAKTLQIVGQIVPLDPDQIYEEFSLRVPRPAAGVMMPAKAPAGGPS